MYVVTLSNDVKFLCKCTTRSTSILRLISIRKRWVSDQKSATLHTKIASFTHDGGTIPSIRQCLPYLAMVPFTTKGVRRVLGEGGAPRNVKPIRTVSLRIRSARQ